MKRKALNRSSVKKIASSFNKNHNSNVSSSTVRRALKGGKEPLSYLPVTHGRQLSAANKKKRATWAKAMQGKHTGTWVYVDSKDLYIYEDAKGYIHWCWQDSKKHANFKCRSNPTVLHFFAAVGKGLKTRLFFVPPTPGIGSKQPKTKVNFASKHFIAVMKKIHRGVVSSGKLGNRFRYILDHAKQHTSKASKAAMARAGVKLVEGFTAQSWDINIIENVWGVLDGHLLGCRARTPSGWRRGALQAWAAIPLTTINKLVASVPERLRQVVEKKGEWLHKKKER
jgi:hypothetical protein